MMTRMRQMSKAMFVLVGLAFIALIVFEWGAGGAPGGQQDMVVGEVNGKELSYQEFNQLYKNIYESEQARRGGQIDKSTLSILKNQVWEQFIQQTLFEEQIEALDIAVSDSEVVYQIMNHPLPNFKQEPSLQTNGVFDINKYRAQLSNPQINWAQIEEYVRQQLPYQKLQNLITNSVRVSESEIRTEFESKNVKAKAAYLAVNPNNFQSGLEASDEEIKAYFEANKEDFKQDEMRELNYISFSLKTTQADTARMYDEVETIRTRLASGEDFGVLALEYSQDPTAGQNSGNLGYFKKGSMVKEFADAAFAAELNKLVGPIKTQFGYHLIMVHDKRKQDGETEVHASHILLKVVIGNETMNLQEEKAKIFAADAKENGWDKTVEALGYQTETTGLFEEKSGIIPNLGRNLAINNFAYTNEVNEISNVYTLENESAYVVLRVAKVQEKGYQNIEDTRTINAVRRRVIFDKSKQAAKAYALLYEAEVKAGDSFEKIANSDAGKLIRYDVTNMFALNDNITGIGRSAAFSATAMNLEPGKRSGLVEGEFGYYYLQLLEKTAVNEEEYNTNKTMISAQLLNQKKTRVFADWYKQLKDNAQIEDKRKYYGIY